jgi:multidrug efflux pump subunit AcrA (membrane-fusion protein)
MLSAKKIFAIGAALILLGGALTWFLKNGRNGHWVSLHRGKISEAIYGLATLEADQTFRYKPAVVSQLKRLWVKEGERVQKNQALLSLSEGPIIRSPIHGIVTQLDVRENETCFPNSTLITVMNLEQVELAITLEQASALRVKPKQSVRVQFESVKGSPILGRVRALYPKEGQFAIRVSLEPGQNLPHLLPGMTADTAIEVGSQESALLAPLKALHQGTLTIRQGSSKKKVKPEFGLQDSEFIEVLPNPAAPLDESTQVWVANP